MSRNPAVILYDASGNPLAVMDGDVLGASQPGLMFAGKDADGYVRFFSITATGVLQTAIASSRNVVGDYYASSSLIAGQATNQNLLSIENPISSGRTIYINRIEVNGVIDSRFTTAFLYHVGRSVATPTGGTALTAQLRDTGDAAVTGIVRQEPTATAASGSIWVGSPGLLTKDGQQNSGLFQAVAIFEERKEIVLSEGEGILIWAEANDIAWDHWVIVHWNEVI